MLLGCVIRNSFPCGSFVTGSAALAPRAQPRAAFQTADASLVPSNMQAEAASHLGGDLVPDRNGDKNF